MARGSRSAGSLTAVLGVLGVAAVSPPADARGRSDSPCARPPEPAPAFQVGNNPPPIPALLAPEDGAASDGTLTFEWSAVIDPEGDTVLSQLQIDDDPAFGSPAIETHPQVRTSFTPELPLPPGTYCWRVRSVDDIDFKSPYTAAFTVTILPPSPE